MINDLKVRLDSDNAMGKVAGKQFS